MRKAQKELDPLTKSVVRLQKLLAKDGDERKIKKLYETLRMQSLVEVYTSPVIEKLVSEEEMSGFILYLDERLKQVITAYDAKRCPYKNYLIQVASFRALNYISKKTKLAKMDFALSQYSYAEEQELNYSTPWQDFPDELQNKYRNEDTINILRYMCSKRPQLQRKIFIYLLGAFPHLSSDVIDNICKNFNIDIDQTLKIYERIFERSIRPNTTPSKQRYLNQRNKNWSFQLCAEAELRYAQATGSEEEQQELEQQIIRFRERNKSANSKLVKVKKKMNYTLISQELNIPKGTVSSTIYFIKSVLKAIGMGELEVEEDTGKEVVLPRFKPFLEFDLEEREPEPYGDLELMEQ